MLKENSLLFDSIKCTIKELEYWGTYSKNIRSVVIETEITDRMGNSLVKIFKNSFSPEDRFILLFKYIELLSIVDSHRACNYIESLQNRIVLLENKLKTISTK